MTVRWIGRWTVMHTDNWTGQQRGEDRLAEGETETQDNSHTDRLSLAEGQSDRQEDCRIVQWTGKGTTPETLRPEGLLWGQQ